MNARLVILQILQETAVNLASLESIERRLLQQMSLDDRDRRFIFEIVHGVIRRQLTLDHYIETNLTDKRLLQNQALMRILRMGLYQIIYLDRVPNHAAVNESLELTKQDAQLRHLSGLVNGLLRTIIRKKGALHLNPDLPLLERLAIEYSHPPWLISRWMDRFGLADTKKLLVYNNERPVLYMRRKLRGISRIQFESESGDACAFYGGFQNLYYRLSRSQQPQHLPLFKDGYCTIQNPASGWIIALLSPKPQFHVCDLCSAPGGKATLLAEMLTQGTLCALDISYYKTRQVRQNCERMDLDNVYIVAGDGTAPPFTGEFDAVLLDAPCSGTGVIGRHPEGRWVKQEGDFGLLIERQRRLLSSAAALVARGGFLVYATCSLEAEENERQIEWFLQTHAEYSLEKAPDVIPEAYITANGMLQITPFEHALDGMFGARLRRNK
ncbi:MAG: 16S rRNA (cytosine(967)-C(5))-methyltransferase RsmB [Chitinivibrionales bacterium]|nr:16S rRNA (cytosine(967)-C(5))-methyltransferase RsmB [Chitinivibrionales bacterium]